MMNPEGGQISTGHNHSSTTKKGGDEHSEHDMSDVNLKHEPASVALSDHKKQALTEKTFKVSGNCGMCETRIEKAAKSIDGVTTADWSKETKLIEVTFDSKKTDVHKIHMAIAKVGHDTEMHKAKDETYNSLPGCCKYKRE
jgi:copper chaperone CopZ